MATLLRVLVVATIAAVGTLALVGCGGSDDVGRVDVQGTATFAGAPIAYGDVQFFPDQAQGHNAPPGSADIVDGKFDSSIAGQGLVPGPHLVRVTAYETAPADIEDETLEIEQAPPLFVGYEMEMDISGSPVDIAVPAEAEGHNVAGTGTQPRRGSEP